MYDHSGEQASFPYPPAKRNRPGALFGIVGFAAGALLVGTVWAVSANATMAKAEETFTLRGTMTLTASGSTRLSGTSCAGTGGYSDIREGASVTVYDPQGAVIAIGQLDSSYSSATSTYTQPCTFSFAVSNVPGQHRFYQVEVSRRGKVTSERDAAKSGSVSLSLGMK
ncbi:hypothetical protein [Allokutzneria albata]|uniref:Uncharacterized protein n=1 Tax=Allokutzneria albata TaxID=211114 RepID=A0A1G9W7C0_ALLAB|nr:hypothetical protein [Allokutzneria albata]SDM80444.1 hypothetical protein SAMN04489726_3441 [Allokutzneria albata]